MANRFSNRADFEIPSELIDEHEWMADELIDGPLGNDCLLVYPPSDSECPNCYYDYEGRRSTNVYKTGGPAPFTNHTECPWCNGVGKLIQDVTEEIRLRVYWGGMEVNAAMKQFNNLQIANVQDGLLFVIGYMNDLPRFERCNSILVNTAVRTDEWKCERISDCIPWGFRKNRYFAAMLKRT